MDLKMCIENFSSQLSMTFAYAGKLQLMVPQGV